MKNFLINEFDKAHGTSLYKEQQKRLRLLIKENKSNNEVVIKEILPQIALYKTLKNNFHVDKTFLLMQKYFNDFITENSKVDIEEESVPWILNVSSKLLKNIISSDRIRRTTSSSSCDFYVSQYGIQSLDFTVTKCMWRETCIENDCIELSVIFCGNKTYKCFGEIEKKAYIINNNLKKCNSCTFNCLYKI